MKETLLNGKFELIEVVRRSASLISLPNGNFVCCIDDSSDDFLQLKNR